MNMIIDNITTTCIRSIFLSIALHLNAYSNIINEHSKIFLSENKTCEISFSINKEKQEFFETIILQTSARLLEFLLCDQNLSDQHDLMAMSIQKHIEHIQTQLLQYADNTPALNSPECNNIIKTAYDSFINSKKNIDDIEKLLIEMIYAQILNHSCTLNINEYTLKTHIKTLDAINQVMNNEILQNKLNNYSAICMCNPQELLLRACYYAIKSIITNEERTIALLQSCPRKQLTELYFPHIHHTQADIIISLLYRTYFKHANQIIVEKNMSTDLVQMLYQIMQFDSKMNLIDNVIKKKQLNKIQLV